MSHSGTAAPDAATRGWGLLNALSYITSYVTRAAPDVEQPAPATAPAEPAVPVETLDARKQRLQPLREAERLENEALQQKISALNLNHDRTWTNRYNKVKLAKTYDDNYAGKVESRRAERRSLTEELDFYVEASALHDRLTDGHERARALGEPLRTTVRDADAGSPLKALEDSGVAAARTLMAPGEAWLLQVTAAADYEAARTAYDAAYAALQPAAWPKPVADRVAKRRTGADAAATRAADVAALAKGAAALLALQAVAAAAAPCLTFAATLTADRAVFATRMPPLGAAFDKLARPGSQGAAPSAADFTAELATLQAFQGTVADAMQYVDTLASVKAEAATLARMQVPANKTVAAGEDNATTKSVAAAVALANKLDIAGAQSALGKVSASLTAQRQARTAAVKTRVAEVVGEGPQQALLGKINDAQDGSGRSIVAELFAEFGDSLARLLEGLDRQADDADHGKASAALVGLCDSLGRTGLGALVDAFGGRNAAPPSPALPTDPAIAPGAQALGQMTKHGLPAADIKALQDQFPAGQMKALYRDAFKGDPILLAKIGGGLAGDPADGGDERIANFKALTVAFPNWTELGVLLDGMCSPDPLVDSLAPAGETARAEACTLAAERLDHLVSDRFDGDMAEMKETFFDGLAGYDIEAEFKALDAAKQARAAHDALPADDRKKVKKPPPVLTDEEAKRHKRLDGLGVSGRTGAPDPTKLAKLLRSAATFAVADVTSDETDPKGLALGSLTIEAERVDHLLTRHTREKFPFDTDALPKATTPADSADNKPTTLWPEGTDAATLRSYLQQAAVSVGSPPAGWKEKGTDPPPFYQRNTTVNGTITVAGVARPFQLYVTVGAVEDTPGAFTITQFYAKSSGKLETFSLDEMHAMRAAIKA